MKTYTEKEIEEAIIRAYSFFQLDLALSYQSMGFVGLKEMLRDIPLADLVRVLKTMDGVILDTEAHQIQVPTSHFKK